MPPFFGLFLDGLVILDIVDIIKLTYLLTAFLEFWVPPAIYEENIMSHYREG